MAHLATAGTSTVLEKECIIGRHRSCGLVVRDDKASRQHSRVFLLEGDWWVEDLGSANGTRLNGKTLKARSRLTNGDVIAIGASEIKLVAEKAKTVVLESIPEDMVGRTINGYLIDGEIGRGVTGTIYTATQLALERGVAFKVMDPALTKSDPAFPERFLKTVTKAASLTHDGLIKIHESGQTDGLLWYTMELVHGDTLDSLLHRDGKLEPLLALMIIEKAADALQAAHAAGLAHGDVKPATIMLTESGHVKVLDIGVVGLSSSQTRAMQGEAATKQVFYLAPEQAKGGKTNVAGDVYSLGCSLVHALSGRPPFVGKTFGEVVAAHGTQEVPLLAKSLKLPEQVDKVISQMMAKNPEWRFESMAEVKAALHGLREAVTPDAASSEAEERARGQIAQRAKKRTKRREAERGRQLVVLAVAVLVVIGVVLFVLPHLGSHAEVGGGTAAGTTATADGGSNEPPIEHSAAPTLAPASGVTAGTSGAGATGGPDGSAEASLQQHWQELSKRLDADCADGDWGAAEISLKTFTEHLPTNPDAATVAGLAKVRAEQLAIAGDSWYQKQLSQLPADSVQGGPAQRLRALAGLRDVTLEANRGDADARYQQALSTLTEQLADARRQARVDLERGQYRPLPNLAQALAPSFADTPVASLQTTFASLCAEASRGGPLWKGDWRTTLSQLGQTTGPASLAAAAALILSGETDGVATAKRLLNDPALQAPQLIKRKEAMLGHQAAVLTFRDPADLQFIDASGGEPRLESGALRGEEATSVACTVPLSGGNWSTEVGLKLTAKSGETGESVVSITHGEEPCVVLRIDADAIHCRVKTAEDANATEQSFERPADQGQLRVRFACHDGTVQVLVNNHPLGSWAHAALPSGSQFHCDFGGVGWAIDAMQVLCEE